jgi:hypothetical protein
LFLYCFKKYRFFSWNRAATIIVPLLFQKVQKLQLEQSSNHYFSFTISKRTYISFTWNRAPAIIVPYCFKKYRGFSWNREKPLFLTCINKNRSFYMHCTEKQPPSTTYCIVGAFNLEQSSSHNRSFTCTRAEAIIVPHLYQQIQKLHWQ